MKTKLSSRLKQRGAVIVVAVMVTSIIAFLLASYLSMVNTQYRRTVRSQAWNSALPVAEAGIEEALTHLNKNCISNTINNQPYNLTNDNWQPIGGTLYRKRGDLTDCYYIVTIDLANPSRPIVEAEGFLRPTMASGPTAQFATLGQTLNTNRGTDARKIKVEATKDNLIAKAMFAKGNIDLSGNGVSTDSFDSADPAHSTDSRYDPKKKKDHGDVATNSDLINSLSVGNANIMGKVSTGPNGTVSVGANGSVGDKAWVSSGATGIQPGHFTDDMNVYVPDVELPFTGSYQSPLRNITLTNEVITGTYSTNHFGTYSEAESQQAIDGGMIYTNTVIATNASYPASGTYLGAVLVVTRWSTNASYPASGTYHGLVRTNCVSTNSATYSNNACGGVTPFTNPTNTVDFPAQGTYVGAVNTNFVPTSSRTYPAEGTYQGTVTTREVTKGPPSGRGTWYDYTAITYNYDKIDFYLYDVFKDYSFNQIMGYAYNQIDGFNLVESVLTTNLVVKTCDYVFDNGNYQVSDLSGKVLVRGNAKVHVTTTMSFTGGSDCIEINYDAALKLYVSAASATIKGQGVLNRYGTADRFYYYGLPSNTSLTIGGNGGFVGCIYAPQANFHLGGGGNNIEDFIGASITKTVKMNGHFNFHYDENLARVGPQRGYLISSWDEVY